MSFEEDQCCHRCGEGYGLSTGTGNMSSMNSLGKTSSRASARCSSRVSLVNRRLEVESGMKTPESLIGRMITEKKDKVQTGSIKSGKNLSRTDESHVLELRYQMELQKLQIVDEERKRCSEIEDEKRRRECDADRLFRTEQAEKDTEFWKTESSATEKNR